MKTLRIFVVLCIVLGFISINANSQPVRWDHEVNVNWYCPCVQEVLSGVVIFHSVTWYNQNDDSSFPMSKQQIKYDGILIGRRTGLEYTIDFIANTNLEDHPATATTFERTLMIRLDGKLIASFPMKAHRTINANGEETVDFNVATWDCK